MVSFSIFHFIWGLVPWIQTGFDPFPANEDTQLKKLDHGDNGHTKTQACHTANVRQHADNLQQGVESMA